MGLAATRRVEDGAVENDAFAVRSADDGVNGTLVRVSQEQQIAGHRDRSLTQTTRDPQRSVGGRVVNLCRGG